MNSVLRHIGFSLIRINPPPRRVNREFKENLVRIRSSRSDWHFVEDFRYDGGEHPATYKEYECGFAASCLAEVNIETLLDIGSYRDFVLGLAAAYKVISLDVREVPPLTKNESIVVADACQLNFADGQLEAVVSLSSLEHFGLGRYGDSYDPEGDLKALSEIKRCLKGGGYLIFSTTVTGGKPCLVYNAHRIYSHSYLTKQLQPLKCINEKFFSHNLKRFCSIDEISSTPGAWDVYCGMWQKPA